MLLKFKLLTFAGKERALNKEKNNWVGYLTNPVVTDQIKQLLTTTHGKFSPGIGHVRGPLVQLLLPLKYPPSSNLSVQLWPGSVRQPP